MNFGKEKERKERRDPHIANTGGLDHVELGAVAVIPGHQGADTKGPDARVQGVSLHVQREPLGHDPGRDGDLVKVTVVLGLVLGVVDNRPSVGQKTSNSLAVKEKKRKKSGPFHTLKGL